MLSLNQINMSTQFTPAQISPTLWIDCTSSSYISTIDNNGVRGKGNIIDSATAKTGQALTTAGTLGSKPIFNGEGWYFESGAQMSTGTASDYNFLHTCSDFEIFATIFICPVGTSYNRVILCNNGFSNTNRGILLRASNSGVNQLEFRVGNGSFAFISLTVANALTVNTTNRIRIRRSGSTVTMFVNGTQVATQTISLGPGVGDASTVMNICQNKSKLV